MSASSHGLKGEVGHAFRSNEPESSNLTIKLYTYFRSSAAYRVRIALGLKQLAYEAIPVHLRRGGGEQHGAAYAAVNPAHLIPTLETGGLVLTQSLAILEYLEETHPAPPLLPADAGARARVRALAQAIACDIHPLDNLRVLQYLKAELAVDEPRRDAWYRHWIAVGFAALEQTLKAASTPAGYCHGGSPTIADCCLVPQVYNARRMGVPLDGYPTIVGIADRCDRLPAFRQAAPEAQPDAE